MERTSHAERRIYQYLLGELPEPEQAALEDACFADRKGFEQLLEAENELVDGYVRDLLSAEQRERFEHYYLVTAERRQRVKFARALVTTVARSEAPEASRPFADSAAPPPQWPPRLAWLRGPKLAFGLALAAAVLLLLGSVFLVGETVRLRRQLARTQAEQSLQQRRGQELADQLAAQRAESERLAAELERTRQRPEASRGENTSAPSPPRTVTFLLTAGLLRGDGGPRRLTIPPGAELVQLRLRLKRNDYRTYRAVLQTAEEREVWRRQPVSAKPAAAGALVTLAVPAERFSTDDYLLVLSGLGAAGQVDEVSKSYFRVVKK